MGRKHSLTSSFRYAFQGLSEAFQNEPNLRIHVVIALIAISTAALLKLNYIEWLILFITIFLVIMLELINTVLENLVNIVSPEFSEYAKRAKDISAGAVLVAATVSVTVGLVLFLPKLLLLFIA